MNKTINTKESFNTKDLDYLKEFNIKINLKENLNHFDINYINRVNEKMWFTKLFF